MDPSDRSSLYVTATNFFKGYFKKSQQFDYKDT